MELKELDNIFLLHKNKIPYSAYTKKRTDIKIKNNLCSYEMAQNTHKNNSYFDGIGIVLGHTTKGTLCGLDIDNCIDKYGNISDNALEIINLLNTYTEISISGKGIHCLFFANKIGGNCKNNNINWCKCLELYDKNRFFTLSGYTLNDKNIEYRQEQCNIIYEKYFCKYDKIKQSNQSFRKNENFNNSARIYGNDYLNYIFSKDKKFKSYWFRTISISDESSADYGFLNKLKYWLDGNPILMKEWFLKSPYFMQKDDSHKNKCLGKDRNGISYLEFSINKILSEGV